MRWKRCRARTVCLSRKRDEKTSDAADRRFPRRLLAESHQLSPLGPLHRALFPLACAVLAPLCAPGLIGTAAAQSCVITSGGNGTFVQPSGTTCAITPGTTLGASPFGFYPAPYTGPVSINASTGDQITANGVTVNWANGQGIGALAHNGGTIIFGVDPVFGGSVINEGINGGGNNIGLVADGGQIVATGLTVNMGGSGNNVGARALNGGIITLNSGTSVSITQGGGSNTGLWASGLGSQIITNDVSVAIPLVGGSGGNDTGVRADGGADVTLNGGSVLVQGNGGGETGLIASGAGSSVTANGVAVSVFSAGGNARGGLLENGAEITVTGGSVTTSGGSGSFGFLFQDGTNALNLSGTTVTSASDAFAVQGGTATIDAVNSTVTGNSGILMSVTGGSAVTMTSSNSVLTGSIQTAGGSTSNVALGSGTTWNMTGSSTVTNLANNDSNIVVSAPTPSNSFKTLTVVNYAGSKGGVVLNTYLGGDNSPSDQIVVSGAATGSTTLRVNNAGGPGDQTTANGIPVVVVTGAGITTPGAFSLAGEVRGGAYTYFLFRGGRDGTRTDDWFLRSTFDSPATPLPVPTPLPPLPVPPPVLTPAPPPATLPPGLFPIIGPELATYGAVQPTARQLGLMTLGTLNQRIGDTMTFAQGGAGVAGVGRSDWARVFGQQVNNRYQAFADPRTDGWLGGLQSGIDIWRGTLPSHRYAIGIYFAYAHAGMTVDGLVTNRQATGYEVQRTGSVGLNAFSAGAYWTNYASNGWYLDAVLQGTVYRGTASTQFAQLVANGLGFISSLEAGFPIPLPFFGPGFVLEPQAQIIWQYVTFDQKDDDFGPVDLGSTSGLTGRVGLRGRWTIMDHNGIAWQPYAGANLWQDWGAEATAVYSGIHLVPVVERGTRLEYLGGLTARLTNRLSFYAEASYQTLVGETSDGIWRRALKGDVGLRYTW